MTVPYPRMPLDTNTLLSWQSRVRRRGQSGLAFWVRALKEWAGDGGRFTGVEPQLPTQPISWLYLLESDHLFFWSWVPGRPLKWLLPAREPEPRASGEAKSERCFLPISELIPESS